MPKLNYSIIAISRCNSQFRSEKMAAFGLKSCHTSYILHICHNPGISQDQLAQRIYINKSNVARQAAFLEEAGYITRTPSPSDKRIMELYPTEKAIELLPQIRQILVEWETMLTEGLSQEEIETVSHILDKLRDRAGTWMNEH